jgi:hypothetical protein
MAENPSATDDRAGRRLIQYREKNHIEEEEEV